VSTVSTGASSLPDVDAHNSELRINKHLSESFNLDAVHNCCPDCRCSTRRLLMLVKLSGQPVPDMMFESAQLVIAAKRSEPTQHSRSLAH
jgi:hypothetical protein